MNPVAIIGLGCRFPGAASPSDLWELLCRGIDTTQQVLPSRFDAEALHHPTSATPGRIASPRGGLVAGADRFDAGFFGLGGADAERIDPQQRLLLAWHDSPPGQASL